MKKNFLGNIQLKITHLINKTPYSKFKVYSKVNGNKHVKSKNKQKGK